MRSIHKLYRHTHGDCPNSSTLGHQSQPNAFRACLIFILFIDLFIDLIFQVGFDDDSHDGVKDQAKGQFTTLRLQPPLSSGIGR